jgi:hypothetical protein
MSQEHDKTHSDVAASEEIHSDTALFEPGYQPETLPKISVPDLDDDAQGLTAEALAQVPTLTEEAPGRDLVDIVSQPLEVKEVPAVAYAPEAIDAQIEPKSPEVDAAPIQETPAQADTWGEELQVRMGKLTGDIHTLHSRLDRLEKKIK